MTTDPLERVRRLCLALPEATEKLSHGEPTFFVRGRVFVMYSNNHHNDGHVAVCVPLPPGMQAALIERAPKTFYRPAYVGVRGWVGIELAEVGDAELSFHVNLAWELVAPKRLVAAAKRGG